MVFKTPFRKHKSRILLKRITVVAIIILIFYASCSTKTYMGRYIKWRASDIEDYKKFSNFSFSPSVSPFHFFKGYDSGYSTRLVSKSEASKLHLEELIETTRTTAFIIIRNDTLLYEKYANNYNRQSTNTSFSTAKSISSLLVGKAIDDSLISLSDAVTKYLPELRSTHELYDSIRIDDLIDMRSGIQFKDHDLPWGDKPKAYYHPRLRKRIKQLPVNFKPGSKFQYNSYNPIVAGMILEKVTGMPPARYFEKHFWNKMGMEFPGSWSMDSPESGMTKMESGINLAAIDFAKFGRILLQNGSWNGEQLISKDWLGKCTTILQEHQIKEYGEEIFYENFWWLYSKDKSQPYIISAWGHLGQYLYVFPEKNIIIVRMGKKTGGVSSWGRIFKELAE